MQSISARPILAQCQPEDDIDQLFNRLSRLEPPGELVSRILSRVRHLPTPVSTQPRPAPPGLPGNAEPDSLIVRNDKRNPS